MPLPLAGRVVAAVAGGLLVVAAAAVLLAQLAAWLIVAYVGFALLLWPFAARGVVFAFIDFPIERDPAEAWPDFVGRRVNCEQAAYAVAAAVYAVPALWSGPRRTRHDRMLVSARRMPRGQRRSRIIPSGSR